MRTNSNPKGASMKTPRLLCLIAAWSLCALPCPGDAQDLAAKGRAVFNQHQASVVTVLLVVKSKMGFAGLAGAGGDAREYKEEVTGTVIDPSGLTAVALSSADPGALLQGMMSSLGGSSGDGEESVKFKMDSEVTDVKLLTHDGAELPAEIVLRDRDLDLAFVRPKAKPVPPLPALDLSNSAKVDVLDSVIAINRLGKIAGRAYAAAVEQINAVVKKPRLFYVPGGNATLTGLGSPAFTPDGKVVGLFVMRSVKSGGGGLSLFSSQAGMAPIIVPAEEVKKVAAQVPAVKTEAKSP